MQDNIYMNALPYLATGIRKANDVVGKTMGPRGTNAIIQRANYPYSETTNDGATIIKSMELSDPIERMGLSFLKEAADRSNTNSGDGSSTTCVLLHAILEEGIKSGINSLELKHELDDCLPIIEAALKDQTKDIKVGDIPAVARIAGENEQLALLLGEVYREIGADGIVHIEGSGTYETVYSLIDGVRFVDTGYLSSDLGYNEDTEELGKKALYHSPKILITKQKINQITDIDPILGALVANRDKTLVIFASDMDSGVARTLIELQKNKLRKLNILIVKAPTLWTEYVYEDLAKITGATIIEDASGTSLNKMRLEYLGTCGTLTCNKEELTVLGIKDISEHKRALEEEGTTDAKLRLSWLANKTAIIKLGAKSETELSYLRLKAEDAVFSCRTALHHGVVIGGGAALLACTKHLPDTTGGKILKKALKAPIKQIIENYGKGYMPAGTNPHIEDATLAKNFGFDATDGKFKDMFKANIIDSAEIVRQAIRNSLGIASMILTTSSVITLPPKSPEEIINQSMMRPMMGM